MRMLVAVALSLFLAESAPGQSLGAVATKEKERRKQNRENVRVIDQKVLDEMKSDENEHDAGDTPNPPNDPEWTPPVAAQTPSGVDIQPAEPGRKADSRAGCRAEHESAKKEIQGLESRLREGIVTVESVDFVEVDVVNGKTVERPLPGISHETRVACKEALWKRSKYPSQARQCEELQSQLVRAKERLNRAQECLRPR
jgi:hypothetical protein